MDGIEIWKTVILPVIQYLIGPIITGWLIWRLTNNKSLKESRDNRLRQRNEIVTGLKKIIEYEEDIRKEIIFRDKLIEDIEKMEHGDFSMLEPEYSTLSEPERIEQYELYKVDSNIAIDKMNTKLKEKMIEMKVVSIDLMPDDIHLELSKFKSQENYRINIDEYNAIINRLYRLK